MDNEKERKEEEHEELEYIELFSALDDRTSYEESVQIIMTSGFIKGMVIA